LKLNPNNLNLMIQQIIERIIIENLRINAN